MFGMYLVVRNLRSQYLANIGIFILAKKFVDSVLDNSLHVLSGEEVCGLCT